MSPLRRTVNSRLPSCVGSTVQSLGSARVGFGMRPKVFAICASARFSSNLPAMSSTALSGW